MANSPVTQENLAKSAKPLCEKGFERFSNLAKLGNPPILPSFGDMGERERFNAMRAPVHKP
jgi:hypothetical protein